MPTSKFRIANGFPIQMQQTRRHYTVDNRETDYEEQTE